MRHIRGMKQGTPCSLVCQTREQVVPYTTTAYYISGISILKYYNKEEEEEEEEEVIEWWARRM